MNIEAMKKALEALEFFKDTAICSADTDVANEAITSLRQAIAEAEKQEPVAWIDDSGHPKHISYCQSVAEKKLYGDLRPLYAQPQPKRDDTPAKAVEWVGLTDEEKSELWEVSRAALPRYATYASLVEAKLKEKNT